MRTIPTSHTQAHYQRRQDRRAKMLRRKQRWEFAGGLTVIGLIVSAIAIKLAIIAFVLWLAYELVMHIVGG